MPDIEAEWRAATAAWDDLERELDCPIKVTPRRSADRATGGSELSGRAGSAATQPSVRQPEEPAAQEGPRLAARSGLLVHQERERVESMESVEQREQPRSPPPPQQHEPAKVDRVRLEPAAAAPAVSGYAVHTGGDAWAAAVGKPSLVPPVATAAVTTKAATSPCPGCTNCTFARSTGGVCAGGGQPTPQRKPASTAPARDSKRQRTDTHASKDTKPQPLGVAGSRAADGDTTSAVIDPRIILPHHLRERTRVAKAALPPSTSLEQQQGQQQQQQNQQLPVICWTRKVLRAHENPALDVAICAANHLRCPLLVLIEVEDRYPHATARRQTFVLEGVAELQQELRDRGIRYATHVHRSGHRQRPACSLAYRSSLVVTEEPFSVPW
jgi:hypothetical protein